MGRIVCSYRVCDGKNEKNRTSNLRVVCHQLIVWCIYWQTTDDHGICLCFSHQNGALWQPEKLGKFGDFIVPFYPQAEILIKNSHFCISARSFVTTKWGKKNEKSGESLLVGNFKKSLRGKGLTEFCLGKKGLVFIDSPFCFENVFIFASNSPLFDQKQRFFRLCQPRLSWQQRRAVL